MSSFRVNKDTDEQQNARKYGPPLRDTDLLGPSPYSTFLSKYPTLSNGKLFTAAGNPIPFISGSNTTTSPLYNIVSPTLGNYNINFTSPTPFTTTPILAITPTTPNTGAMYDYNASDTTIAIVKLFTPSVTINNTMYNNTVSFVYSVSGPIVSLDISFDITGSTIISNFQSGDFVQLDCNDGLGTQYNMTGSVIFVDTQNNSLSCIPASSNPPGDSACSNFSNFNIFITRPAIGNFNFIATQ